MVAVGCFGSLCVGLQSFVCCMADIMCSPLLSANHYKLAPNLVLARLGSQKYINLSQTTKLYK